MRKPLLLLSICFLYGSLQAQTLLTVGGEPVSTAEFKRAFLKNNPADSSNPHAMRDYLELYIKYKLKIKEAYARGIDTLPGQRSEALQFKTQIAEPYMLDATRIEQLTQEAMERSKTDILLNQIFIPFSPKEAVDGAAKKSIEEAHALLKKGAAFADVAKKFQQEPPSAPNSSNVGWITAFTLPYAPESVIYQLKTGAYSAPLKSSAGYHIFKKEAIRPSPGSISTAHILIAFPPAAAKKDSLATASRADSIWQLLKKGASFPDLAKAVSDDNATFLQGGELPPFTTGEHQPSFEAAAFALEKDGEVSQPVLTEYGYHIIKRLKKISAEQLAKDPLFAETIRQRIYQDARSEQARDALVNLVLKKTGSKLLVPEKALFAFSTLNAKADTVVATKEIGTHTPILKTGSRTVDALEWMRYVGIANNPLQAENNPKPLSKLLDDLRKYEALQYYREHLEEFQPAFAQQYNEFKEGNMLFEIMQKEVWDKSSADTAGLKQYFQQHKERYYWNPAAEAVLFTCSDNLAASELKKKITAHPRQWQSITDGMDGRATADSAKMEWTQLPITGNQFPKENSFTEQIIQADGSILFAYVFKLFPQKEPRSFEEARGFVLNDYQSFLEETWVKKLKEKFPVAVNQEVFKKLSAARGQ